MRRSAERPLRCGGGTRLLAAHVDDVRDPPGDRRGFVRTVRDGPGSRRRHNTPLTPMDRDIPALDRSARRLLRDDPVRLSAEHARIVGAEFETTAHVQGWSLLIYAIMWNHVHLVVGLPNPGDSAAAADALRRFKAYASKRMNARFGRRERWWTQSGSRRLLPGEPAVVAAVR